MDRALDDHGSLWCQHEAWLRTVIACRIRSREAIDEILSDVALCLTRQQNSSATQVESLPAWLYRVTLRRIITYRRRLGVRQKYFSTAFAESDLPQPLTGVCPLDAILVAERRELFQKAFDQLTPGDRQILLLKHQHHWTYDQLSTQLGVSRHTIEYRLIRARRELRARLIRVGLFEEQQP